MKETLRKTLKDKGIRVSEQHLDMLVMQMASFQQLKKTLESAKLADYDIGLKHVPGGEHIE